LIGGAAGASGCGGKECKLIGCSDGFSASVRSADGSFPGGMYRDTIPGRFVETIRPGVRAGLPASVGVLDAAIAARVEV
jgi:hypothetical protein